MAGSDVPATGTSPDPDFQAAFDRVARARGLAFRKPVPLKSIDAEAVRAYVRRKLASDLPPHAVAGTRDFLFALGQVDSAFELSPALEELYASELMGLYDPDDRAMYLKTGLEQDDAELVLHHELVHALQDQHYDLGRLVEWREGDNDAVTVIHALAEGDATSAMLSLAAGPGAGDQIASLDPTGLLGLMAKASMEQTAAGKGGPAKPSVLQRMLLGPYFDGLVFVQALRKQGGWQAVDAAWRKPPASTEQLLHPAKYFSGEAPEEITLPKLGTGDVIYQDVMGEQGVRMILEEWLPPRRAAALASGWAGDRFAVYKEAPRSTRVVWHLRYDTQELAEGVARGFAAYAPRGSDGARTARFEQARLVGGRFCLERAERGPFAVVRRGRDLAVVAGPFETPPRAGVVRGCAAALATAEKVVRQGATNTAPAR